MKHVVSFLTREAGRLGLERHGVARPQSWVLLTPQFPASRHVIMLIMRDDAPVPALVVKVPRLRDDTSGIAREAASLRQLHRAQPESSRHVPEIVWLDERGRWPFLVETALVGQPLSPDAVRRQPRRSIETVAAWLLTLPRVDADARSPSEDLIAVLDCARSLNGHEHARLLERTAEVLAPLSSADLPRVFEHGDVCHPNLLLLEDGETLGVLDWELAEPRGMPLHDLCFFLAYVAFALAGARTVERQLAAYEEAFIARRAWARSFLVDYAERLHLSPTLLTPLLVACWARYTTGLMPRLQGSSRTFTGSEPVSPDAPVARLLREHRYYALWRHTVAHAEMIEWP